MDMVSIPVLACLARQLCRFYEQQLCKKGGKGGGKDRSFNGHVNESLMLHSSCLSYV